MHDAPTSLETEHFSLSATFDWDLGSVNLKSLTAYQDFEDSSNMDVDGTELPIAHNGFLRDDHGEEAEFYSQEFILNSTHEGPLQWTVLINYSESDIQTNADNWLPLFDFQGLWDAEVEGEAFGFAGQVTYSVNDQLNLTGGVRYSDESKDIWRQETFVGIGTLPGEELDASWEEWTPRFVIDYFPSEEVMLYASATKGFKAGGFNIFASDSQFDPEYVWSYELGVKSTLWDGQLRANAATFYYDYTDIQLQTFNPDRAEAGAATTIENAGEASNFGVEADFTLQATEALRFELGLAYLDAEIEEWVTLDPDRPEEGVFDREGNSLPRAPDLTVSFAAEYTKDISPGILSLRGEYYYRDDIYFTAFEDERVMQDAINLFNANVTLTSHSGRWYASLFGKNLTDEEYVDNVLTAQQLIGQISFYAPPRTYGIQVGFNLD